MKNKTKKIKFVYEEIITDTPEMIIISVMTDYPEFKNRRKMFLYELADLELVSNKFNKSMDSHVNSSGLDYLTPIFLTLNEEEYNELMEYLENETICEEVKWTDDIKFLSAKMSLLKLNPKFWEI